MRSGHESTGTRVGPDGRAPRGRGELCRTAAGPGEEFLLPWSKNQDFRRLRHLSGCPQAPFCPALLSKLGFISSWKEGKWRGWRPKQASRDREGRTMAGSERFLMQSIEGGSACKTQVFVFVSSPRTVLVQKKKHTGKPKKKNPSHKTNKTRFLVLSEGIVWFNQYPCCTCIYLNT